MPAGGELSHNSTFTSRKGGLTGNIFNFNQTSSLLQQSALKKVNTSLENKDDNISPLGTTRRQPATLKDLMRTQTLTKNFVPSGSHTPDKPQLTSSSKPTSQMNMTYYSKLNFKNNVLHIQGAAGNNQGEQSTSLPRRLSNHQNEGINSYYLKVQSKGSKGSKQGSRAEKIPVSSEYNNRSIYNDSANGNGGSQNKTTGYDNKNNFLGKSLDRSKGLSSRGGDATNNRSLKAGEDSPSKETSREPLRQNLTIYNSKFNLGTVIKKLKAEDSNSKKDANYLLSTNQHQKAFKRSSRGRPLKNSLLRTVFNQ
jgi:hypothetical protein